MKINLTWKKNRYVVFILLFLLLAAFGIRACTKRSILGERIYTVAYDKTWYPLDLRGRDHNMAAFCQDILVALAHEANFELDLFEVGPYALFDGLNDDSYDAVLSSKVPNVVNRREFDFSDPIYPLGPVLVVRMDSKIKDPYDLQGKVIGVEVGTQQLYQISEESDFVMIPFKDISAALESLDHNVIDAVLMEVLPAYSYIQGFYKGKLRVATSPLLDGGIRVVTLITPNNERFIAEFNRALKKIREEGIYDSLLRKWDLIKTELTTEDNK